MKISELLKQLRQAGCYIVEHGKEHDKWYSPITKKHFRIPRHPSKEIPTGTLRNIEKDAGLR